ncbi:stage II sporulation protein R [Clostridiales bacterium NSJ-40]|uniref:Stage II sporulation protein R n=1 Tax=Yeguia hominis TaxID=2763662 RepID=A0A926D815_9FIRM|nr:stage II sporulation protein R [Yeguia hominis]MBC8532544.1 stage II sporulation protein R [Yeguia hominis]
MEKNTKRTRKNGFCRWEKAAVAAFLFCILLQFTSFSARCSHIEESVLRMHVLANSDSVEDQTLKRQVRDRVLAESAELLAQAGDKVQAEQVIRQQLPRMQAAAEAEVRRQGYSYPVRAELENCYFPTRKYETVTLPAGRYDALRIEIGEAGGHNWWCVIFPAMCLPAAQENRELESVLSAEELEMVEDADEYAVAFKTVEVLEKLRKWLRGSK